MLFWAPDSRLNPVGKLKPPSWEPQSEEEQGRLLDHFTQQRDGQAFSVFVPAGGNSERGGIPLLSPPTFTPEDTINWKLLV